MSRSASPLAANALPVASRYAWFVLIALTLTYGFNFVDRYVFVIMMEPLKRDLGLSDTQLGLTSGLAFSLIYSISGLFVAHWADRGKRRSIIAMALGAWSVLTILCGLTRNFSQLLGARLGVGITEAGCSPPAHSLISDYFPARQRAVAFAIYSIGLYAGLGGGFALGGWIGEQYGWRAAFIAAGLPGLLFAMVLRLTVREPERGATEIEVVDSQLYSSREVASYMLRRPSFLAYMLGSSLFVFAGAAIDQWAPLFLMRVHGEPAGEVGLWTGMVGFIAGLSGCIAAGWIADRLAVRDQRWYLWVASGGITCVVVGTLLFVFGSGRMLMPSYFLASFFNAFVMPPTIAITQRILPVRMRALGSAVMLVGYNVIGMAGCNFAVGFLSDLWQGALHVDSVRYAMAATQLAAVAGLACTVYAIIRMPRDFREQFGEQVWVSRRSSVTPTS